MVKLVGILNITPDSFSDGGQYFDPEVAIQHAEQLFKDGAAIIDIGAESTRPNAKALSHIEEWERLEPVLHVLMQKYPGKISLDSYHPETVEKALRMGPLIINDVTGMNNPSMMHVVVRHKASVIISHLPGVDIQAAHMIVPVVNALQVAVDLLDKAHMLQDLGIEKKHIILDPGIGFGKTAEVNIELLEFAKFVPGYKVMIGYSRKRFLGEKRMDIEPNLHAGRIAKASGAYYLRVHDVVGHASLM